MRPQSAQYPPHPAKTHSKNFSDDLPVCTFKSILNHIVDRKMFKDSDMKVLYVRLCHKYSEDEVDEIWDALMDEL